jgi:hypothetical protein
LDDLSAKFRVTATRMEIERFVAAETTKHQPKIFNAVEDREAFEVGEYLVLRDRSYILTDRRFCFYPVNDSEGGIAIFALDDIAKYDADGSGLVFKKSRVTLRRSEEVVTGKKMAPDPRLVRALMARSRGGATQPDASPPGPVA